MSSTRSRARAGLVAALAATGLVLAGCGDTGGDDGSVTLSILVDNTETTINTVQALADAYTAAHQNVKFELETRPQGAEGDNITKTRLQTGDMNDLFYYNAGSLLQALAPEQTLVDLSGEAFVSNISDTFIAGVSSGDAVYGVPVGNAMGGGILYNLDIYEELDLEIPQTWSEFMANNQAVLGSGIAAPVIQTYGPESTWTSQLFVLGDNYNVLAEEPDWAEEYTSNQAHFADTPAARRGFDHLREVYDRGFLNADFASANYADGLAKLASGEGAHYPMLTFAVTELTATQPDALDSIGFFAIPGDDPDDAGLTTWLSASLYLPQTTENVDEAKGFLAFVASVEACDVQTEAVGVTGPYFIEGCTIPADVPQAVKDLQSYFDAGLTAPALEFLSPVKGPALEQICIEVGSGIRTPEEAAELYDVDVEKQAQQLGLPGW